MALAQSEYSAQGFGHGAAIDASAAKRKEFIQKTYAHTAGATAALAALDAALLQIPGVGEIAVKMFAGYTWLLVLAVFMGVSHIANKWAHTATTLNKQYMGLGLFILAEAIIFLPLLYIASAYFPQAIPVAGIATLALFAGLTLIVFTTGADFSFLRSFLTVAFFVALGLIVCGTGDGSTINILLTGQYLISLAL